MKPDFATAVNKAQEILAQFGYSTEPLCILKRLPNVLVYSFAEVASKTGKTRDAVIAAFHEPCASVSIYSEGKYFVVYNQRMPFDMVQKSLAKELGHIILGHDGSRPEDVRQKEAEAFASALLVK